jgi:KTSC domain-containing protein
MPIARPLRMTNPVEVRSSSLARLFYDGQQAILQVEFCDGTQYQYSGVPLDTYQNLLQADSRGSCFNHYIRNCFPYAAIRLAASVTSGLPRLG